MEGLGDKLWTSCTQGSTGWEALDQWNEKRDTVAAVAAAVALLLEI